MSKKIVGVIALFLGLIVFLMFQATRSGTSQVFTPSQLLAQPSQKYFPRIRVVGRVANNEIGYRMLPSFELTFKINDPGTKSSDAAPEAPAISVIYKDIKPDMFAVGRDVILDGEYSGGVLQASHLLTQCPSKYEAPPPGEKKY